MGRAGKSADPRYYRRNRLSWDSRAKQVTLSIFAATCLRGTQLLEPIYIVRYKASMAKSCLFSAASFWEHLGDFGMSQSRTPVLLNSMRIGCGSQ